MSMVVKDSTTELVEDTSGIRVAVYGSLRKDLHNHYLLNDAEFLGADVVPQGYRMVSLGGFPAVLEATDALMTPITVEVYRVTEGQLNVLDCLEGHPDWYKRRKVLTRYKNAWMYVMPDSEYQDHNPVDSGDWLEHYTDGQQSA